jgi:hypothetical protein
MELEIAVFRERVKSENRRKGFGFGEVEVTAVAGCRWTTVGGYGG